MLCVYPFLYVSKLIYLNIYYIVSSLNPRELLFSRAVIFTVEEINKNPALLNGVTLGYRIYNGCEGDSPMRAAIEAVTSGESCSKRVQALIGHSSSGVSKDVNRIVGPLDIPLVRHLDHYDLF